MARKVKIGLDYFPHSCDLDDELKYIIAIHKEVGYYIYFRLLEKIYSGLGYYIKWDKKNIAIFSNEINVDINKLNDVVNDCLSEKLFSKHLLNKFNIITSKGIQERYLEAIDRRKEAIIINEYILVKNDYINKLNVNIIIENVDKSTQSKVKESKVKEIIYKSFSHLEISKEENQKLIDLGYKQNEIDSIYESIENYKNNTKYKSLYLTAKNWLEKKYGDRNTKKTIIIK